MPDLIPGLGFLAQVAVVLLAFSFMVFVHELGHYLAARLVGVRVERFFVGFDLFGLSISKKIGHTVYGVGALPLGGYCALAGQNDDPRKEVVTGAPDELRSRPLWAQCLVFVSGVLMNFLFGFVLLVWAEMYGIPFVPNVVGDVVPGEPAEVHGLRKGDRILFVDGTRTDTFEDVYGAIAVTPVDQPMRLTVLRPAGDGGERLDLRVRGRQSEARGNLNTIGVVPPVSREVYAVPPDYRDPVLAALLRPGDEIVAVDGEPVPPDEGAALEARLLKWPAETVRLTVRRPGEPADFDVEAPLRTVGRVDFGFRVAVIVDKVTAGAAADDAGVEAGDQIVGIAVDGEPEPRTFRRSKDFTDALAETSLRRVDIGYLRGGREYLATLKPRGMPGDPRHAADEDTLLGVVGRFAASGGGDGEGGTGPAPDAVIGTAAPGGGAARGFVVREVLADGPADGVLEPGDVIVDLANRPLDGATPLRDAVLAASTVPFTLVVRRPGDPDAPPLPGPAIGPGTPGLRAFTARMRMDPRLLRPLFGITYGQEVIVGVEPESVAARAFAGDRNPVGARLVGTTLAYGLATARVTVAYPPSSPMARSGAAKAADDGEARWRTLIVPVPAAVREDPLGHGLERGLAVDLKAAQERDRFSFGEALPRAGAKWAKIATMVFSHLGKLVTRDIPVSAMGGPVKLFEIIKGADDRGFGYLLYIVALISINLGICNILPFPVLDGGHCMFLLYEAVVGRPPSDRFREVLQYIGLALILALMLTVTGYDLRDLFGFGR